MNETYILPFDRFWSWLLTHPNCIIRAGTPEVVLHDDEALHWGFFSEGPNTLVAQLLRGKMVLAELLIDPETVAHVRVVPPESEGEFPFELVGQGDEAEVAIYFFVMIHPFDEEDAGSGAAIH